jgi:dimethylglycine catabolism B
MTEPTMSDDAVEKATTLCAYCPKMCRSACPVSEAEARETVTPWAKMNLVRLTRSGASATTSATAHQAMEACTGCGACSDQCAHGNPVTETLFSARATANTARSRAMRDAFHNTGDAKGRDAMAAVHGLHVDAHAPVAYFPGCTRCHHDGKEAVARDQRVLAMAMGSDVPICDMKAGSDGGQCCGYPLYADGQGDALRAQLLRLQKQWRHHEVIITPDPGCAYVLSTVRQQLLSASDGPFPQVLTLVDALAPHADKFRNNAADVAVRYHDPCYLGRRQRSFDAPRNLLSSALGRPPIEFKRHHDDADCSGAGGLYPTSNPDGAKAMAHKRAQQVRGHEEPAHIVTACPSARRNFERAGHTAYDLVDVLLGEVGPRKQVKR